MVYLTRKEQFAASHRLLIHHSQMKKILKFSENAQIPTDMDTITKLKLRSSVCRIGNRNDNGFKKLSDLIEMI